MLTVACFVALISIVNAAEVMYFRTSCWYMNLGNFFVQNRKIIDYNNILNKKKEKKKKRNVPCIFEMCFSGCDCCFFSSNFIIFIN